MKLLRSLNRPLPGWLTFLLIAMIGGGAFAATPLYYGTFHVATTGAYVAANPSGSSHCGVLPTAFDFASQVNGGNHYLVGDTSGDVGVCGDLHVAGATHLGGYLALSPLCTDSSGFIATPCTIAQTASMPAGHLVCSGTNTLTNYTALLDQCQNTAPNAFAGNMTQTSGTFSAFHLESNDVAASLPVCSNVSGFITTSGCTASLTGNISTVGPLCTTNGTTVVSCNANATAYNYPAHGVAILIDSTDGCGSVVYTCNATGSSCASGSACGTVETTHGVGDCTTTIIGSIPTGAGFSTATVPGWIAAPYFNASNNHFGVQFFNFTGGAYNFGATNHAVGAGFTCLI
jgi:hypothetical protein